MVCSTQNDTKTKCMFLSAKLDDPILIFKFRIDDPCLLARGRDDNRIFVLQASLKFTELFHILLDMTNMVVMITYSRKFKRNTLIHIEMIGCDD
jgi:hypothetical protein